MSNVLYPTDAEREMLAKVRTLERLRSKRLLYRLNPLSTQPDEYGALANLIDAILKEEQAK